MPSDKELEIFNPKAPEEGPKKYKKIELGDTNTSTSPTPIKSVAPIASSTPSAQTNDPLGFWPQITSGGYKPSIAIVQNIPTLLKNKRVEWSDTWFSILFQKIIKKVKYEQEQNKPK